MHISLQGQAPIAATVGAVLQAGDAIQTQPGAEVVLRLSEGSELHLGPKTEINLADLFQQPTTGARRSRVKLTYGRIRAFLSAGHQKEGSAFTIETPNAVAGVKFSHPDIEVIYYPETKTTVARAYTVKMTLTNLNTGAEVTVMPEGHQAIIHNAMIVITKITDVEEIFRQMRDMPDPQMLNRLDSPQQGKENTMELLQATQENIGVITPATSQLPPGGTRPEGSEKGSQAVGFTYTIDVK